MQRSAVLLKVLCMYSVLFFIHPFHFVVDVMFLLLLLALVSWLFLLIGFFFLSVDVISFLFLCTVNSRLVDQPWLGIFGQPAWRVQLLVNHVHIYTISQCLHSNLHRLFCVVAAIYFIYLLTKGF